MNINEFVGTSLYRALIRNNAKDEEIKKPQKKDRSGNKRTINIYIFQNIFKECSKKLADVIANNALAYLEPARQSPEAKEVEHLYTDLWGKIRPSNSPIPVRCALEDFIQEYFPPVLAEEISEWVKKIRNKTVAGPDGLENKHLLIRACPQYWRCYTTSFVLPLTSRRVGETV